MARLASDSEFRPISSRPAAPELKRTSLRPISRLCPPRLLLNILHYPLHSDQSFCILTVVHCCYFFETCFLICLSFFLSFLLSFLSPPPSLSSFSFFSHLSAPSSPSALWHWHTLTTTHPPVSLTLPSSPFCLPPPLYVVCYLCVVFTCFPKCPGGGA